MSAVALYWDFENLHASLVEMVHGKGTYAQRRCAPQEALLDLRAVVRHARALGPVAINRAYGDWQWMASYRSGFADHAMELIQLFSGHGAKNSADIRMAIDVVDDLHRLAHVSQVVIVGGDSDFVPLAQRVRLLGRVMTAVGTRETASPRLVAAVDDFVDYATLTVVPAPISAAKLAGTSGGGGQALLEQCVTELSRRRPDGWVGKAAIKPFLQQLEPGFGYEGYGCRNLAEFLERFGTRLVWREGPHGDACRLARTRPAAPVTTDRAGCSPPASGCSPTPSRSAAAARVA